MFMSQMKDGEHLKWCSGKERPHPCITSSTYLVIKFSIHYKWWLSQSLKRLNGQAKDPCCLQLVMRPWLRAVISSLYQPLKSLFPQLAFWEANTVLPRDHTGHGKHPLLTTQEKTLHMYITRWSVPKSDWLYSLQLKMEKLYRVSKNKTRSWLWLRSWTPCCQIQT